VLRVGTSGTKTWNVVYRVYGEGGVTPDGRPLVGKTKRLGLGRYPAVSLAEARAKALQVKSEAAGGKDPALAAREEARGRSGNTVASLAALMVKRDEQLLKPSSLVNQQYAFDLDILPEMGNLQITQVTRGLINTYLDNLFARKGKSAAQESRKALSKLLNFATEREYIPANPMQGMKRPDLGYNEGERTLSLEEARKVYEGAGDPRMSNYGPAVRLMLLTALRKSNVTQLQWDWVDAEKREIVVPAEHYKSNREHRVPLSPEAWAILDTQPRWNGGPYVFSASGGVRPINSDSKAMQTLKEVSGVDKFSFHDLRRTVVSRLAELGYSMDVRFAVAGQLSGNKLDRVYNREAYEPKKREALERWSSILTSKDPTS